MNLKNETQKDKQQRFFTEKKKINNYDINKIVVIDVETFKGLQANTKSFGFAGVYTLNFQKIFTDLDELKTWIFTKCKKKFVFCHNAIFDLQCIFGNLFENLDNKAIFNGSQFISAKCNDVTFLDSFNLLPMSLKKVGQSLGLEKLENTKIASGKLNKNNVSDIDYVYCLRDCEIVFKALDKFFTFLGFFKITVASCALEYFRQNYWNGSHYVHPLNEVFFESYCGGRVEAFKLGFVNCQVYDINSLYPSAMSNVVLPDFSNLKCRKNPDLETFLHILKNYEGCASIEVHHKKSYFGFLPLKKDNKLIFPTGNFTTTVNFLEIRFALEHNIIDIKNINYVVYGAKKETIFKEYVNEIYTERQNSSSEFEKLLWKLLLNALYGKFGSKPQKDFIYLEEFDNEFIEELERKGLEYKVSHFNKDRIDCRIEYEKEIKKYLSYSIISIASYITSYARVLLLKNALNNYPHVRYCDTDSLFIDTNHKFIGHLDNKILGAFKDEEKNVIEINGLKNYKYFNSDGQHHQTLKGVSKSSIWNESKQQYETVKFHKSKAGLINGQTGELYLQTKKISGDYSKREILFCKNTVPITLDE